MGGLLVQVAILFLSFTWTASSQDLSVPTTWGSGTSSDNRATREGYANGAAQALVDSIVSDGSLSDQSNGQALASMYSMLAVQDLLSGNKTWEKVVTTNIQTWVNQHDVFGNGTAGSERTNTNGMHWALALYYAYKAYGQQSFLTLAQQLWDLVYVYFITSDMVNNPQAVLPPTRNSTWINLRGFHCFNNSTIGGVFALPDVSDSADIRAETMGPFAMLSGYFYEETQNETYKTTGLLNIDCMNGLMYYTNTSLIWGVVNPQQCNWAWLQSPGFQGWYISALSVWANITGDPDGSLTERLRRVVSAATVGQAWTETGDGVLLDPESSLSDNVWDDKAILIRSLSEHLRRSSGTSDISTYIQTFLTIQYNALVNNARAGQNYTTSLTGPIPHSFNSSGNIVALDVLNAAFDLLPSSGNNTLTPQPSTTSTSTPVPTSMSSSSHPVGAIVGGAVGGIAAICALAGGILWHRRTRHRAQPPVIITPKEDHGQEDGAITPFLSYTQEPLLGDTPVYPVFRRDTRATAHPKFQRMNALPQPSPPESSVPVPSDAPPPSTSDIMTLVRGVINNVLRDHGAVPPEYEQ